MTIHWNNLVALTLGITAMVLFIKHRTIIAAVLADIQHIGPGHSSDQQTIGLILLAVLAVTLVAIIKLLTTKK